MWGSNNKQVETTFWDGLSLLKKSLESNFGFFMESVKNVDINIDELIVPKVIVIGAESSGKSSLLENIIKCPIFPKNSNICTKQPIHLKLKSAKSTNEILYKITYKNIIITTNKNKLLNDVKKIMDVLDENTIINDEILIEITDFGMLNFEFYDLPGIRAYPPEMALKTSELVKFYLKQENIIPICVIPATLPRITSYMPMALIKEFNKEKSTIIVLTMADRVQEENIYELLVQRLINKTDEFKQCDFAGCVSVINRSHKNNITLVDNDVKEEAWFFENIVTNINNNYIDDEKIIITSLIKNNTTISKLVFNLDNIYNEFIKVNWIPNTIKNLETKNTLLNNQLTEIGFDPNDIKAKSDFKTDIDNVLLDIIFNALIERYNDYLDNNQFSNTINYDNFCYDKIKLFIIQPFNHNDINKTILNKNYHPERFKIFFDKIFTSINKTYEYDISYFINNQYNNIEYDYLTLNEIDFIVVFKRLFKNITAKILKNIRNYIMNGYYTMDEFINLEEDLISKNNRNMLNIELLRNNKAIENIIKIKNVI